MKAITITSIILMAAAGILAIMAGGAFAAPGGAKVAIPDNMHYGAYPPADEMQLDPALVEEIGNPNPNTVPPDTPQDDGVDNPGDDNPDNPGDDNPDNPGDDNPDNPGDDNPDNPGDDSNKPDNPDNPGVDETPDNPTPVNEDAYNRPDTNTTTTGCNNCSGKLPNTGTQLAFLAAIAFLVGGGAYVARRAAGKRVR